MPAPQSELTTLANALKGTKALHNLAALKVYAARKYVAEAGAAPRIVLVPLGGPYRCARQPPNANIDVDLEVIAYVWGGNLDETRYLITLLYQALEEQGANEGGAFAGFYWDALHEDWTIDPDTAEQGEAVKVHFKIAVGLAPQSGDEGHVPGAWTLGEIDAVQITST